MQDFRFVHGVVRTGESPVVWQLNLTGDTKLKVEATAEGRASLYLWIGEEEVLWRGFTHTVVDECIVPPSCEYVSVVSEGDARVSLRVKDEKYSDKEDTSSVPDQVPVEIGKETIQERVLRLVDQKFAERYGEMGRGHDYSKYSEDPDEDSEDDLEYGSGYQPKAYVVADLDHAYDRHIANNAGVSDERVQPSVGGDDGRPGENDNRDRTAESKTEASRGNGKTTNEVIKEQLEKQIAALREMQEQSRT